MVPNNLAKIHMPFMNPMHELANPMLNIASELWNPLIHWYQPKNKEKNFDSTLEGLEPKTPIEFSLLLGLGYFYGVWVSKNYPLANNC